MKDETGSVAIEGFVELKSNIYSFLVDDNSKHKKAKGMLNKCFSLLEECSLCEQRTARARTAR